MNYTYRSSAPSSNLDEHASRYTQDLWRKHRASHARLQWCFTGFSPDQCQSISVAQAFAQTDPVCLTKHLLEDVFHWLIPYHFFESASGQAIVEHITNQLALMKQLDVDPQEYDPVPFIAWGHFAVSDKSQTIEYHPRAALFPLFYCGRAYRITTDCGGHMCTVGQLDDTIGTTPQIARVASWTFSGLEQSLSCVSNCSWSVVLRKHIWFPDSLNDDDRHTVLAHILAKMMRTTSSPRDKSLLQYPFLIVASDKHAQAFYDVPDKPDDSSTDILADSSVDGLAPLSPADQATRLLNYNNWVDLIEVIHACLARQPNDVLSLA